MENLKKTLLFLVVVLATIVLIGSIGTLFYVKVESSNFFATGLAVVYVIAGIFYYPKVYKYLVG